MRVSAIHAPSGAIHFGICKANPDLSSKFVFCIQRQIIISAVIGIEFSFIVSSDMFKTDFNKAKKDTDIDPVISSFSEMKKRQDSDRKKIHTPCNKGEPSAETVAAGRHL